MLLISSNIQRMENNVEKCTSVKFEFYKKKFKGEGIYVINKLKTFNFTSD